MELHSFQLGMVTGAVRRFITPCPVGGGGIFCGGRTVSARDARVITERVQSVEVGLVTDAKNRHTGPAISDWFVRGNLAGATRTSGHLIRRVTGGKTYCV